ncbi:SRPBCC family protein [Actinoplanes derwentensis]|uniref:Polyketide cyclase / dehydrase and lipid transport n=1 Tax=Actinoplanes derwentensis TaxID=113562 RepID=A0A1H1R930_9ACTN|nr:SRPBCC family protein [Actinoplanes derwentensis]GID88042.1 hypothetical protein Ade03nite_69660 [Actinoplanes derwentensis]SDS32016.1 Polyketide cyclase / dehydrase and lipid transport [Actinoplanes derwentensis]
MPGYDIINEAVIDAAPEQVWAALIAELHGARAFWVPANTFQAGAVPPERAGGETHVTVHPKGVDKGGPKLRFTSRTVAVEPGRRLAGEYVDGAFRGTSEFLLEQLPDGGTLITMRFAARPAGWVRHLAKLADIGAEHTKATAAAFAALGTLVGSTPSVVRSGR